MDELWIMAWAGSVQRANVFAEGSKDTREFRAAIKKFVWDKLIDRYKTECNELQHYRNIAALVEFGSSVSPLQLKDGIYRYGVAQKLLNLFLKYCWCAGHIGEPPHCPVDRIVINKTHLRDKRNWTQFRTQGEYQEVIEAIKIVACKDSLALWELKVYSRP